MANSPSLGSLANPPIIDITDPDSWPAGFARPGSTFVDANNPTKAEIATAVAEFNAANTGKPALIVNNEKTMVGTFDGSVVATTEALTEEVVVDRSDVKAYFDAIWAANYAGWQAEADSAWANIDNGSFLEYNQGNFLLPAGIMAAEATQDGDLLDDLIDLVQAAMDNATESPGEPSSTPGDTGPPFYPATYYGWTTNEYVNSLSEMQWAVGAAKVAESVAVGRAPQTTTDRTTQQLQTWAENALDWLDHNMVDKHWDQGTKALQRYNMNNNARYATLENPTDYFSDKMWIGIDTAFTLKSGMAVYGKTSIAWAGDIASWRGPDDWYDEFWKSKNAFLDGDGSLIWDFQNPLSSPLMARSTPPYPVPDTLHMNRMGRCIAWDYLRRGFVGTDSAKAQGLANTVVKRLWNGRRDPEGILINNFITGEQGHDYEGGNHGTSGIEGWGWVYNGFLELGIWDERIQQLNEDLLAMVREGVDVGATYGRHNTVWGQMSLAAALLWTNYWKPRLAW